MRFTTARAQIGGELLIAENGQPLFEAELEPIAAGDAVARPIVEIFVRDHAFDALVIGVGRGFGPGQDQRVVEDIEPLVLHRAHVEVGDGDDHEGVEIVFEAEALFVPFHRALERFHRPGAAVLLAGLDIDPQVDLALRARVEAVLHHAELSGDQREEIGRLRERVFPDREVAPARRHRRFRSDCRSTSRTGASFASASMRTRNFDKHVRPVEVIGDAPEAFRLALRAIDALRTVKPGQRLVRFGIADRLDFEREGLRRARPRW